MNEEIWKDVVGYEGLYLISSNGNVKSISRRGATGKILKLNKRRYARVVLTKSCIQHTLSVHRIVATAFITNPSNKPQVNHKDGNKLNNSVSNLEWSTPSENTIHALRTGLQKKVFGENHGRSKLTEDDVSFIRNCKETHAELARRFNIDDSTIRDIRLRKIWKHVAVVILFSLILINSSAQPLSTSLPNWLIDSMTFEVFKGRQCSLVVEAQQAEIKSLGAELLATGTALTLATNQIQTLEGLVKNYETGESLLKQENKIREKWFKEKIKRLWKVIVLEGVVILVILLL